MVVLICDTDDTISTTTMCLCNNIYVFIIIYCIVICTVIILNVLYYVV